MLLFLLPSVLQTNGLVENQVVWSTVLVDVEVADALELQVTQRLQFGNILFDVAVCLDVKAVWVNHLFHCLYSLAVLLLADASQFIAWVLNLPQTVVQTYFSLQ